MGVQYRISEGVLLKNQNGLLWALVNGKWRDYPEITRDWFTNSNPIDRGELAKRLGHAPSDAPPQGNLPETGAPVQPSAFADISGYDPNAAGLVGEPKRKPVAESAPHDVSGESRDKSGKWTKGGDSDSRPKLNQSERNAIDDYTADKFKTLNKALRSGQIDRDLSRTVNGLDSAISKLPPRAGTTFRIMDATPEMLAELKPGKTFSDSAFLSTSKRPPVGIVNGKIGLQIVGKSGRDLSAFSQNPGEDEVLFPRDTQFKVVKVADHQHGGKVAILQEVGRGRETSESSSGIGTPDNFDSYELTCGEDWFVRTDLSPAQRQMAEAAPPDLRAAIAAAAAAGYETICGDSRSQMVYVIVPIDGSNN